jgi:3'-phosphoadenosine 5'-phosphosulfate sulfotransferase (PAPS reductase)/FAD synthetase
VPLLDSITAHKFDAVFGGGRRDEERARAKERIFSLRNSFGQWEPRRQRPELWNLYNGRHRPGEHVRVFPLSNWTELDVWHYIEREDIELPSIYYAHQREVYLRDGMWLAECPWGGPRDGETLLSKTVIEIWRSVLGVTDVDAESDFFRLGGESLLFIRMITQVQRRFGVSVEIAEIADALTPAAIAAQVARG